MKKGRLLLFLVVIIIAALIVARVIRVSRAPIATAEVPWAIPPTSSTLTPAASQAPTRTPTVGLPDSVANGEGVAGSDDAVGCGDGLWAHVYHPSRLHIKQDCLTVTGVIMDATANQSHPRSDGVRKEADGDTHGWLKIDPEFENLINDGNRAEQESNLVFEIVCFWRPTQADAKPACIDYQSDVSLPLVGTHVTITGTFVRDTHHDQWNEIHPVSRIEVR